MLKFTLSLLFVVLSLTPATPSTACVGRTLYLGALQSNEDALMAEMLALLINERTGTTIQIRTFKTADELYNALKSEKETDRVDIIVEDTVQALALAKLTPGPTPDQDFIAAKDYYEKTLNVVWLNPFGYSKKTGQPSVSAPLLRRDILTNFPLLPRVLNKLAGAINDATFQDLMKAVNGGDKPKNVAKEFLKKQKFI